jgi:hypothetical protein
MVKQDALMVACGQVQSPRGSENLPGRLGQAQVLPDEVDFMLYRLLTGLTHILNACFYLRRGLL